MFKNYLKMAWRGLFRSKLHTVVNLGGLVIGFTIGIGILLVVYSQFSYDDFHVNRDRLYQAYEVYNEPGRENVGNEFGLAAGPAYKAGAEGIERVTRLLDGGNHIIYNGRDLSMPVMMADEDFFGMFSFTVIRGQQENPLKEMTSVVLSETGAKRIFGNEDPIGRRLQASVGNKMQDLVVTAVVKDPVNSTIRFDVLTRIENLSGYAQSRNDWENQSHFVYVELKEGVSRRQAELELRDIDQKARPGDYDAIKKRGGRPDKYGDMLATRLLPLSQVHFSTRVNGHRAVSYGQMMALLAVGLFIVLIACFNFININLANAFSRSREIGVRKCLGAMKGKLVFQLWGESFLVCLLAFLLSLGLVNVFLRSITGLAQVRESVLPRMWKPGFLGLILGLLFFVSLLAGGYPSWLMARFRVVETLKGRMSLKGKSGLRSSLIVLQFVIACIMISCTLVVYRQFDYMVHADVGFDKEGVISVPLQHADKGRETIAKLRVRLAGNPDILSVTGSNINMGRGADHRSVKEVTGFMYKDHPISTSVAAVDYDYLKTFGLRMIDGRDFDARYSTDTLHNVIISESAARQYQEKNMVGKIVGDSNMAWRIVGVFPDFHLYSMAEEIQPLTLTMDPNTPLHYCFVKVSGVHALGAMEAVKKEMRELEPGAEFTGSFVNDNLNNWYIEEQTLSVLFLVAAIVAIVLSCMGLLAMVLLMIQQRIKEVGIRKVLGAGMLSVSILMSGYFLRLVLIAVLISTPASWIIMSKWLQDFPYRIALQWWMFVLVGLMAILTAILTIGVHVARAALQNPIKHLRAE